MNPTEHPPHSSRTEIKLQWIAIACMALGLVASIYFHANILKEERIENELSSYLHLNDKYHSLLFKLIDNDPEVFQKKDNASLQKNRYIIYELFELFSTIESVQVYFHQLDKDVVAVLEKKIEISSVKACSSTCVDLT